MIKTYPQILYALAALIMVQNKLNKAYTFWTVTDQPIVISESKSP